ncbi:MAG: glycosyltransferase family 2 protein [Bacteroidales bacterium]|nr:glycosyltransferase family 2 protein [Bacteroidales bacterium]
MKSIAALTMVRNGEFYLSRWVGYYGDLLGKENLYIYFDGTDQTVPDFAKGCNTEILPRTAGNVREADKGRIKILSDKAAGLFKRYDYVIGTDVDEFLVPDPKLGVSLPEFLSSLDSAGRTSFSGLGCDVIQHLKYEQALDRSKALLQQRSFACLSTRYTKTSVLCKPVPWGSGFHRTKSGDFHIVPDLYLFHFGCADVPDNELKLMDKDLAQRGWGRHLNKRMRLIRTAAELPVSDWDKWTGKARLLQSWIRRPFTWNKPAMLNLKVLVRIPERFRDLV